MGQSSSRGTTGSAGPQRDRSPSPSRLDHPPAVDSQPEAVTSSLSPLSRRLRTPSRFSRAQPDAGSSDSVPALTRRRSRLTRARSSLTSSIPGLFQRRTPSRMQSEHSSPFSSSLSPASRPTTTRSPTDDSGYLPPPPDMPDLDLNFDDLTPAPNTADPAARDGDDNDILGFDPFDPWPGSNTSDRTSSSGTGRGLRSMTNSLRRRRSPQRREDDQAAMLSRLLSIAAAATAASLMGGDHRAVSDARAIGDEDDDGTFDSFLQALQNGRIASALRQNGQGSDNVDGSGTTGAPLNFFRMFRFGSSSSGNRRNEGNRDAEQASGSGSGSGSGGAEEAENASRDGRMVPIIIVGIRSITPGTGPGNEDNIPPFLDALSSFPTSVNAEGDNTIDGILRQPQNGTRFSHRRRASMGGLSTFPSNYDSQRHQRSTDRSRPWSTFSDTPQGPRPPPSTPASTGLSAVSSGNTTPNPATPPSSGPNSGGPSRRESFIRRNTATALGSTEEEPQAPQRTARQRRVSESDFTRFGSGASRRNGVVEPDHNPGEGARSWIIYVLGGSYPENHPILTTPSLFTDTPTYEDMLLLSALLGPAKPPVASRADVEAAPGLYTIRLKEEGLVAHEVGGEGVYVIGSEERCLVCLCDFEAEDEARRLVKCGHLFHRECIDQWLTTGRNSCPLCRGQGVEEKTPEVPDSSGESPLPSSPPVA